MTAIEQGMSGFADEKQLMMALEDRMQKRQAQAQNQYAQSKLDANDESARAAKEALEQLVENATKAVKTTAGGSGIGTMGKVAIGIATGLMVGGYASGNPLNDKSAQQVSDENQASPIETMSIPDFMDKQGGYVPEQGLSLWYVCNCKVRDAAPLPPRPYHNKLYRICLCLSGKSFHQASDCTGDPAQG